MRKKHILPTLLLAAAAFLAVAACKDDDDTETKPSLSGMTFTMDSFARGGDRITVKPYGVVHPDGGPLYYYISVSSGVILEKPDTILIENGGITAPGEVSFSFTLPDSLADYSVTCAAIDVEKAYYSSSTSNTITVVRPYTDGSVTGDDIDVLDDSFIDPRTDVADVEKKYYYAMVAGTEWFRNNLAYTGAGVSYYNFDVLSYSLGRYYTYEEAIHACPQGWRLPSESDWLALGNAVTGKTWPAGGIIENAAGALMADIAFNGLKMWEYWPAVKITNAVGLAFLPAGYVNKDGSFDAFVGVNNYAAFWTSTLSEDGTQALFRYINVNSPDLFAAYADKNSFAASVRCVR